MEKRGHDFVGHLQGHTTPKNAGDRTIPGGPITDKSNLNTEDHEDYHHDVQRPVPKKVEHKRGYEPVGHLRTKSKHVGDHTTPNNVGAHTTTTIDDGEHKTDVKEVLIADHAEDDDDKMNAEAPDAEGGHALHKPQIYEGGGDVIVTRVTFIHNILDTFMIPHTHIPWV